MTSARTRWLIGGLLGVLAGLVLSLALIRRTVDQRRMLEPPGGSEWLSPKATGDAAEAQAGSEATSSADPLKSIGLRDRGLVAHRDAATSAAGPGQPGIAGAVEDAARSTAAARQVPGQSTPEERAKLLRAHTELLRPSDVSRIIESVRSEYAVEAVATPEAELALLQRAAASGKPDALLALGLYLAYATEGGGDPVLAADLFRRAHEAGSARALAELGRLHLSGLGVPLDPDKAAIYFDQARSAGDAEGLFLLAMANRLDLFAGADPARARSLLAEAADRGHVGAQTTAFLLHRAGELDFGGQDVVVPWLEAAAQSGDSTALFELAKHYLTAGSADAGLATLTTAAEAGSAKARELVVVFALQEGATSEGFERGVRLAREMTAVPGLADERALFLRAAVEFHLAQLGRNDSDPLVWLRLAEERKHHRATIARLRLERGDDPAQVFRETAGLSGEQAFMKLQEMRSESAPPAADALPRPVFAPQPLFPAELNATRQSGRVVVAFVVDLEGNVTDLSIVEASHPAFAAAALEALQHWRYMPGRKGGMPVRKKMKLGITMKPD